MTQDPNALDMLDAWWAVPEAKRAEALARLSAMIEANGGQAATPGGAADRIPEAKPI
ncbi:MAG: hypothetical protein JNK34_01375 [Tabrizicola sp.]|nr:hypothetical protein [Tabrizicola sp.]